MTSTKPELVIAPANRKPGEAASNQWSEVPPSNAVIDALERVLPDMPALGALMLLLFIYLACTGSDFGASSDVLGAMQESSDAATQSIGYVPF
jgi:hypothetical protein